ncbi:MAG: GyrI-like domain-containing protein [Methanomicrobiales archaeon]|nr:GyrI-like domain-containing protein [Methanomicrobiales archaeon]
MEEVTLIELPSLKVLGIRQHGPYRMIPELLSRIFGFVMKNHLTVTGMPMFLLREESKEKAMEADRTGTADVEVVVPVTGEAPYEAGISSYTLPGGKMARIIHRGPYETSELSYQKIFTWIAENGYHVAGPIREIYYNNPQEVKPEDIMTEIMVPVEKA